MKTSALQQALSSRYIDPPETGNLKDPERLAGLAGRGSCRKFKIDAVPGDLLRLLLAIAFAAPTKSDLQQRDVVIVTDPELRKRLDHHCRTQAWLREAPLLLVFCGNHRRQQRLQKLRGHEFVNDHFDATFNAAVDAGILMAQFMTAAEMMGLGCCPVSAIRNEAREVSDALGLPSCVFPVAGLALGWPLDPRPEISMRMPLASVIHENGFDDSEEAAQIKAYDDARADRQPYARQRFTNRFGETGSYVWSEDKARQYAAPEREAFGQYMREQGLPFD